MIVTVKNIMFQLINDYDCQKNCAPSIFAMKFSAHLLETSRVHQEYAFPLDGQHCQLSLLMAEGLPEGQLAALQILSPRY